MSPQSRLSAQEHAADHNASAFLGVLGRGLRLFDAREDLPRPEVPQNVRPAVQEPSARRKVRSDLSLQGPHADRLRAQERLRHLLRAERRAESARRALLLAGERGIRGRRLSLSIVPQILNMVCIMRHIITCLLH